MPTLPLKPHLLAFLFATVLYGGGIGASLASTFDMDFPVKLNGAQVAQLTAIVDGMSLHGVSADELKTNLANLLSDEVLVFLTEQGTRMLNVAELTAQGISLEMNPQDLTLTMVLAERAMATGRLSYSQLEGASPPSEAASWAVLNNFNVNHQRTNNNQSYESLVEWLLDGNVGGGDGINFAGSGFWQRGNDKESLFYRGDFTLYYDEFAKPRRYRFGDIQNQVTGHLSSYQLGGISVASEYNALQPQRNLSPGNSQVFVLSNTADLDVYVNGFSVSRIRLRAGRYDIKDLPLTSGSNNIRIVAEYINGETETFEFSTHYNAQLLAEGITTYQLLLGNPTQVNNRVYHYLGESALVGSFEHGFTDWLTFGANGLWHQQGKLAGVTLTTGQSWGNTSWRFSASDVQSLNGYAMSLEAEHNVLGGADYGAPNLRWGVERQEDFIATPWLGSFNGGDSRQNGQSFERYFFDYSYYFSDSLDFGVTANVQRNLSSDFGSTRETQTNKDITAALNWRHNGLNIAAGMRYQDNASLLDGEDNQRWFVNATWNIYHLASQGRTRFRYNSRTKVANATYTKVNSNYLGDYGYQGTVEHGDDYHREQIKGSYTANWLRTDVSAEHFNRDEQGVSNSMSVNLSTSVGIADGNVGIGTNVSTPFAVVEKHKTLKGSDVLVNVDRRGKAQSESADNVGTLVNLGTGYNQAQFNVDVPNAPFGYDWGPGAYVLAGGAATGHYYMVGSDLSYTVLGVLLDEKGEPLSLQRGEVIAEQLVNGEQKRYRVFTNRAGRFVIEGVGVGQYAIKMKVKGKVLVGEFAVVESDIRFVSLDDIKLRVLSE